MKFNEWWDKEESRLTSGVKYPAMNKLIRDVAFEAWVKGSHQGIAHAAKASRGSLFRRLKKVMSNKWAGYFTDKVYGLFFDYRGLNK